MKRGLTRLVLAASVMMGSGLVQGMGGMDMSTSAAAPAKVGSTGMANVAMGNMDRVKLGAATASLDRLSGKAFDRAFLSLMVPHHKAAVEMSQAVLPLTKNATVRGWARRIITSQQREISIMTALLRPLGGADVRMAGMMDMAGRGAGVRSARNPDAAFVQGMLPHHSSAIDMAKVALQRSSDPNVLKLAQNIVQAQAREMYEFRSWLLKQ